MYPEILIKIGSSEQTQMSTDQANLTAPSPDLEMNTQMVFDSAPAPAATLDTSISSEAPTPEEVTAMSGVNSDLGIVPGPEEAYLQQDTTAIGLDQPPSPSEADLFKGQMDSVPGPDSETDSLVLSEDLSEAPGPEVEEESNSPALEESTPKKRTRAKKK